MPTVKLIVRCGDGDEYHDYDDLALVASDLALNGVNPPLERRGRFGVQDQGVYTGNNYISIYRGEWPIPAAAVEDNREITNAELKELNTKIARIYTENGIE